jgi:hypothetical protein
MNRRYVIVIATLCGALLRALVFVGVYPRFKKIEKRGPAPESVAAVLPGDVSEASAAISNTFSKWLDFDRPDRIGNYRNKFPQDSQWSVAAGVWQRLR